MLHIQVTISLNLIAQIPELNDKLFLSTPEVIRYDDPVSVDA